MKESLAVDDNTTYLPHSSMTPRCGGGGDGAGLGGGESEIGESDGAGLAGGTTSSPSPDAPGCGTW